MTHLDDGQLRAHLDGQLPEAEARHLESCGDCRARLAAVGERAQAVHGRLDRLAPAAADPHLQARPALARFHALREARLRRKDDDMLTRIFGKRFRTAAALLLALVLVAVSFTFAPVRAWAGEFLGLFRVQQVAVLPVDVDTSRFTQPGDEEMAEQIGQLMADSVRVIREPGEPRQAADAAEASALAGFSVRLPGDRADAPEIAVQDGAAFEFTVDRERAQAVISEAGLTGPDLPESLDGAIITVDIPAGVAAQFGECPPGEYDRWRDAWNGCMVLAQIPSPTVTTPPDLDVAALAEIGLQFAGMTPAEARAFSRTVDWTSTLVVPIPRNAADYRPVAVDGTSGYLMTRNGYDGLPARYVLLWVKDGIVYSIAGFNEPEEALKSANSLR